MATDLTPAEREDKETERLINRRPAPSRKHRERRAPRHDQRRRRIREDDTDLKKVRKDRRARTDDYDRMLDRHLSDIESILRRMDDEDDDATLDAAIEALSDASDLPPERIEKLVEKHDDEALKSMLLRSDLDFSKLDELDRELGLSQRQRDELDDLLAKNDYDLSKVEDLDRALGLSSPQKERLEEMEDELLDLSKVEGLDDVPDAKVDFSKADELDKLLSDSEPDYSRLDELDQELGLTPRQRDELDEILAKYDYDLSKVGDLDVELGLSPRQKDDLDDLLEESDYDLSKVGDLDRALGLSASYRLCRPMSQRTGAYHGVVDVRGNPTDSPNTVALPDRRYFTEKDYDLIVKTASDLLKEDWFKHEWEGGSDDAPVRAALDIAIQTANGNVYQSKIDSETYELLLNRLAKWGYDTFSETVLPMKKPAGNRSASAMKNSESYRQIIRVASDLRESHPSASFSILKSLRSLVSTEAESIPVRAAAEAPAPSGGGDEVAAGSHELLKKLLDRFKSGELTEEDLNKVLQAREVELRTQGVVSSSVASSAPVAAGDAAEIPLPVLLRAAASGDAAKSALGPYILAASKKKKGGKKGKVPPQFLKNMKGKKDDAPKKDAPKDKGKGKSKKAAIAAEDASW